MQCLSCGTELLRPANFCPVCGARLSAPISDGSAATTAGNPPTLVSLDDPPEGDVVYLSDHQAPAQPLAPNPHAAAYDPNVPPTPVAPAQPVDELAALAAAQASATPAPMTLSPLPAPEDAPVVVGDNPFGNFFGDGPSAWLEDDLDDDEFGDEPRMVGTLLAAAAITLMISAWVIWGAAMYEGAGGAEAGGFVLLSLIVWVVYLSLPKQQQHRRMLRSHERVSAIIERRVNPLRSRTEGQLKVRRERGRYRSMRDERTRRVTALGELAYRGFRHGTLPAEMHTAAQRVLAMEQRMMLQDHRLHELARPDVNEQATEASAPPAPGQPTD